MASDSPKRTTELCPSPHLEAADLPEDTVVTIKSYDWHPVGKEEKIKGVLYFREFERGMVMNRTNTILIKHLHGDVLDELVGKQIVIGPDVTNFGGNVVPCIRVRNKAVKPSDVKLHDRQKQSA